MKVEYSENKRIAFFDGYKFRLDLKTGYYLSTKPTDIGRRERLHCYVWRHFKGEIPPGYHVHHADKNKSNNDIDNLRCIPGKTHTKFHSCERAVLNHDDICRNLIENAGPKAAEWHRSESGRQWHREHYSLCLGAVKQKEHICEYCGKKYFSKKAEHSRFCSGNCRASARRKSGVDDETRKCVMCGKEFKCNKYSASKTCSRECGAKLCWDKRYKTGGQRAGV